MKYIIRHKYTGMYSKGGVPCPSWTDDIEKAKIWKKLSFLKSHITSIKNYRKKWGLKSTAILQSGKCWKWN